MKFTALVALAVILLGGGLAFIVSNRRENERLRLAIAKPRHARDGAARTAAAPAETADAKAAELAERARALSAEIEKERHEVAALEQRAYEQFVRSNGTTASDDPEKGMTRLEDLKNVGRSSPAKAFETLAWAGLHGDAEAMSSVIGIEPDARPQFEALIASLPPAERIKYPTPERLIGLFLARGFVNLSGIEIVDTKFTDPGSAELTVRGLVYSDQHLPMRLGPDGWQLWEGTAQIGWLREQLAAQQ